MSLAFATITGPDCLRDLIKQFGLRLKVYRTIRDMLDASNQVFGLQIVLEKMLLILLKQYTRAESENSQSDATIILVRNHGIILVAM